MKETSATRCHAIKMHACTMLHSHICTYTLTETGTLKSNWVSVQGLTSHLTDNRSFQRRVFPDNQLHWYWQPKTMKQNTTYTRNTKEIQKKWSRRYSYSLEAQNAENLKLRCSKWILSDIDLDFDQRPWKPCPCFQLTWWTFWQVLLKSIIHPLTKEISHHKLRYSTNSWTDEFILISTSRLCRHCICNLH